MNKKVAIAQNRFQKGGRMQVTVKMIEVLNEIGIVPELVCFKTNITKKEINALYKTSAEFHVKELFFNPRIPFEWNILLFNFIARPHLRTFDLIINSNNTSFLASQKRPMISYVHYPRKDRVLQKSRSIHFPEGEQKSMWDYPSDPFFLAKLLYRFDTRISPNDTQIANSEFTKAALLSRYAIPEERVKVIFPPVGFTETPETPKQKNLVVSLGRFSPEKRQLEQLELAKYFPELTFRFYGFVNSQAYFSTLQQFIKEQKISNVSLLPNASYQEIQVALDQAEYFLHSVRNEPFGITTVQAIQKNCIPLVHNSGGQKEIVIEDGLRYDTFEEAVSVLRNLISKSNAEQHRIKRRLYTHIQRFSEQSFKEAFRKIVTAKL